MLDMIKISFWHWLRKYIPERKQYYTDMKITIKYRVPLQRYGGIHCFTLADWAKYEQKALSRYLDRHEFDYDLFDIKLQAFMELVFS